MSQPQYPYQRMAQALRDLILDGTFPPGRQLPTRRELCTTYAVEWLGGSVSDQVVGGAMRDLHSDGLVVTLLGAGVYVAPRDQWRINDDDQDPAGDRAPAKTAA